ncbi:WhiB family transcriptional regulator [Nocardioides baekrokdamisoli]|nr:WhiB family transcriptional regulator [Nocardioides baekrokdamisoli]
MREAACRNEDPDLFFPPGESKRGAAQSDEARGVCGVCGVRQPCLELALRTNAEYGIWGGFSPKEVGRIRGPRSRTVRF